MARNDTYYDMQRKAYTAIVLLYLAWSALYVFIIVELFQLGQIRLDLCSCELFMPAEAFARAVRLGVV